MTVSKYLCFVAGERADRIDRLHASSQRRTTAFGIALHLPVMLWAGSGYLVATELFRFSVPAGVATALVGAVMIYLVERLVMAAPPSLAVNLGRVVVSLIAAILGASAVDLVIFQREVAQQMTADARARVESKFDEAILRQQTLVNGRKTDWLDAQRAANCEADGTCGSRVRSVGPVYRQLARQAELLREDYREAGVQLDLLVKEREAQLRSISHDTVMTDAGLLARIDALHRYAIQNPPALVAWGLVFLLVATLELMVLLVKATYGETVDDCIERLRERVIHHKANAYFDAVTSPFARTLALLDKEG